MRHLERRIHERCHRLEERLHREALAGGRSANFATLEGAGRNYNRRAWLRPSSSSFRASPGATWR
jgi:hypothetical protein